MSVILSGILATDILRAKMVTRERFDARECRRIVEKAFPSAGSVSQIRQTLERGVRDGVSSPNRPTPAPMGSPPNIPTLEFVVSRHTHGPNVHASTLHYISLPLPAGSLLRVDPKLGFGMATYVVDPALNWLLASADCGRARSLEIAMELCGTYSVRPDGSVLYGCDHVCTPEYLRKRAHDIREVAFGHRIAGWEGLDYSMPYILSRSASPMETKAAIMLSLPVSRGGWGINGLELNRRIDLTRDQQVIAGKPYIVIDGYLAGGNLGYEYDSDEFHSGHVREERDRLRATAAQCFGTTLLSLTRDVIESTVRFAAFCDEFSRLAGKRKRPLGERTLDRRMALRHNLGLSMRDIWQTADEAVPVEAYRLDRSNLGRIA